LNLTYTIWPSGGSNFSARAKAKTDAAFSPAAVDFTTDLHSLGQFLQDGRRNLFETFIMIEDTQSPLQLEEDRANLDGLNYLSSLQLEEINRRAYQATADAHASGGVPNMTLWLPALDAENLGLLMYFFEISIAVSGYLAAVNPFDQPGVEAYKTNMFQRLGKQGFALPEEGSGGFPDHPRKRGVICAVLFFCCFMWNVFFAQQESSFPFISLNTTGIEDFQRQYPGINGDSVVVFILDSGVDMGVAGLEKLPNGEVKVIEARDFSGQGDVYFDVAELQEDSEGPFLSDGYVRLYGFFRPGRASS
jgi:hypothetical protein